MPLSTKEPWWRRLFGGRWPEHRGAAQASLPASTTAATPAPPAAALVGGRYRLQVCLGRGAVGAVYRAADTRSGQVVALKLVPLPTGQTRAGDDAAERARREADAAGRLRHPGIVAVLDGGQEGGQAWLAMEYVAGTDLSRYTRAKRLLPEPLVLRIGARIARALAHAHRQGVVHRDLKPANVLVDLTADVVKLADFGVARLEDAARTRTGLTLGTPAYMAPELLTGEAAAPAADTYALGVVLFELLCGRRPTEGSTLGELLRAVATAVPADLAAQRPDLPASVAATVNALLQRRPGDRPQDLDALADRLDSLADTLAAAPA